MFTKLDKYKYSVLDVAQALNMDLKGTGDTLAIKEFMEYYNWLKWRIDEAWDEPSHKDWEYYDLCIWMLADAAIQFVEDRLNQQ